jgi:hypothetical protein
MVLHAVYGISHVWSSMNPVMLGQLYRKLLPDLEDNDLQCFPSKELSKSEILGLSNEKF